MLALLNLIPGFSASKAAIAGVLALALCSTSAYGAWVVTSNSYKAAQLVAVEKAVEEYKSQAARQNAAAESAETNKENARVVTETIEKQVDRIVYRPVYRNVCLDADGLRLANDALAGKAPAAGLAPAPVPAAARRSP